MSDLAEIENGLVALPVGSSLHAAISLDLANTYKGYIGVKHERCFSASWASPGDYSAGVVIKRVR